MPDDFHGTIPIESRFRSLPGSRKLLALASAFALTGALALSLAALPACSSADVSSEAGQPEEEAESTQAASREDVEVVLLEAAGKAFCSVTFAMESETSVVGAASDGTTQMQAIRTVQSGELDQSEDLPQLHMKYVSQSSMELGKITYDMFINSESLIVQQGEQLYVDAVTDDALNSYAQSVTNVISPDGITELLDMASGYKIEEANGETKVTVTIDVGKLREGSAAGAAEGDAPEGANDTAADVPEGADAAAGDAADSAVAASTESAAEVADEETLPSGTQVATMVASYTIGEDGRFKTMRMMSSSSGSPTYRVKQTYRFADYDTTVLPEWPDLDAYIATQSGIMTDESGRMYIVGDDGARYYVSDIGDDGTIYYDTGTSGVGDSSYYYYDYGDDYAGSSYADDTAADAADSSSSQGRAYITAEDGTIHYLDEEGSRILDTGDGRLFIDADGNYYFLSEE